MNVNVLFIERREHALLLSQGPEPGLARGALQHEDYYYHQYYYRKLFNHFLLVRNVGCFQFLL